MTPGSALAAKAVTTSSEELTATPPNASKPVTNVVMLASQARADVVAPSAASVDLAGGPRGPESADSLRWPPALRASRGPLRDESAAMRYPASPALRGRIRRSPAGTDRCLQDQGPGHYGRRIDRGSQKRDQGWL